MGQVIEFKKPNQKQKTKEKAKGKTLCINGFHKWAVDKSKQFDVKSGKLVTVYRCERCNEVKVKAH
ncbi:hypothetical protein [Litoribacillus peritrichatus]|uniref:ABC transporter permease n=1 Tax=Litoribacillus peritrichatus TaxID=718191 RepID=A0ABP7M4N9_9GAMM